MPPLAFGEQILKVADLLIFACEKFSSASSSLVACPFAALS
jgi:hypothetical protein